MKFKCDAEDEYISLLKGFGFLYKLDVTHKRFSSGPLNCEEIDSNTEQVQLDTITDEPMNNTQYLDTLMNVTLLPENINAKYTIDEKCNFDNLFKEQSDQVKFYSAIEQLCHQKNSCEFDPENLPYNTS